MTRLEPAIYPPDAPNDLVNEHGSSWQHHALEVRLHQSSVLRQHTSRTAKCENYVWGMVMTTCLEPFFQFDKGRKIDQRSFHAIKTFYNDENLLPRSMSTGLSLADRLAQDGLEMVNIVVLERT